MADPVFTSWADLYQAMLNAAAGFFSGDAGVASFDFNSAGSSRRMVFRSVAEFKEGLAFVKEMADLEAAGGTAITAAPGRTYAHNGRYRA